MTDRREFLRDCVRYPVLAGLAVLGGWLALKPGEGGAVEACLKQRVCRGCGLFSGCGLPQAVATRKNS